VEGANKAEGGRPHTESAEDAGDAGGNQKDRTEPSDSTVRKVEWVGGGVMIGDGLW
jgi:hypothetical protein